MSCPTYPCTLESVYPYSGAPYSGASHALLFRIGGKTYAIDTGGYTANLWDRANGLRAMYPDSTWAGVVDMSDSRCRAMHIDGGAQEMHNAAALDWQEAVIPFSGFYESHHDAAIDDALSFAFQDSSGSGVHDGLQNRAFMAIDFRAVHLAYAQSYASDWAQEAGLESAQYVTTESPREYNFETDRILVKVTSQEAARIFANVDRDALDRIASERHSHRSGFISSYSPNVESWGGVESWDHNQLGTLLLAHWETTQDSPWCESDYEAYYGSELECNGLVSDMLFSDSADESGKATRAANVAGYLREREERDIGTGAVLYQKSANAFDGCRY